MCPLPHASPPSAPQALHLQLDAQAATPLVVQIVEGIGQAISDGTLRAGSKLPSIRQMAASHQVSVFTVVEAYDRLVALGQLQSRPQAGFFVRSPRAKPAPKVDGTVHEGFDAQWYLRRIFENRELAVKAGCGWLPGDWLFEDGLKRALRVAAQQHAPSSGYGDPKGYAPLRLAICDALAQGELQAEPAQVLLTQGSSQALDLAVRRLVKPGDAVLVDEPSYANLLFALKLQGARLLGVPRTPTGWDLSVLQSHVQAASPKVFFTQPRLQSPTGSVASLNQLHRVLQLADAHGFVLVENDIYALLDEPGRPSLASLDGLARVISIGSYSKTISPSVRVGYAVAPHDLIDDLAQLKMVSGLTSAELGERLVHGTITDGRWRKHLKALRERLGAAHQATARALTQRGFELFAEPKAGMFLWARHACLPDALALSQAAAPHDIMLGPGHLFATALQPTPWLRFNVAFSGDARLWAFLDAALAKA